MPPAMSQQPATPNTSQTQTQAHAGASLPPTLTLRGEPRRTQRRGIRWAADVVDNEGMGKKSSKVCCIYHKPREVGESSSESDSSDSSASDRDSELGNSAAQMGGKGKARRQARHADHGHDECAHDHRHDDDGSDEHTIQRRPSPNAYERMPKVKTKKGGSSTTTEVQPR